MIIKPLQQEKRFAFATYDTSFKHMMTVPEVRQSFVEAFTERSDIVDLVPCPTAIPHLRIRGMEETQRHMDFFCRIRDGDFFITEVQIERQDCWNKRALYYASGVYAQQLRQGAAWASLQNVIGINILDYDSQTLPAGDFERRYVMTDMLHPHDQWPFLMVYQIELPRVNLDRMEESPKKQWLKILKESATMDTIPEHFDPVLKQALGLLELNTWKGDIMTHYHREKFDHRNYVNVFKEQWDKGREEGINQGLSKGAFEKARDIAIKLLCHQKPLREIIEYTGLSEAEILSLQQQK